MTIAIRSMKEKNGSLSHEDEKIPFKSGSGLYFLTLVISFAAAAVVIWNLVLEAF